MPDILKSVLTIKKSETLSCDAIQHTECIQCAVSDLTDNSYQLLQDDRNFSLRLSPKGVYDELIEQSCALIHCEDRAQFSNFLSRQNLSGALCSETPGLRLRSRRNGDGDDSWIETCILRIDAPLPDHLRVLIIIHAIDHQQQSEEMLRQALNAASGELQQKEYYQELINASVPIETLIYRLSDGQPSYISGGLLFQLGYTKEDFHYFHNQDFMGLIHPEDYPRVISYACTAAKEMAPFYEQEFRIFKKSGGIVWILEKAALTHDAEGQSAYMAVYIDITDRKAAEEALRIRDEELRAAMSQMGRMYCRYNIAARTLELPRRYAAQYGLSEIITDFPQSLTGLPDPLPGYASLCKRIINGEHAGSLVTRTRSPEDGSRWEKMEFVTILDDAGNPVRAIISIEDVTEEKTHMMAILQRARSDGMTGLLNKATLEELVSQWLSLNTAVPCVLLVIDLDDLKQINDTLGHSQGDRALTLLSDTLRKHFRSTDMIGRIGGDEFVVFLPGLSSITRLRHSLSSLIRRLSTQHIGEKYDFPFRASIGAAFGAGGEDAYADLFKRADTALYRVKRNGKNGYSIFGSKP